MQPVVDANVKRKIEAQYQEENKELGEEDKLTKKEKAMVKDLDKEMTEASTGEKDAQADYEQSMRDSAEKRAGDTKSLTGKNAAKADMEAEHQAYQDSKTSTSKELAATLDYIRSLHSECDWLVQYYDIRKEARDSEIDALGKAK